MRIIINRFIIRYGRRLGSPTFMSVQQRGGNVFTPSLMAITIALATSTAAMAADAEAPATIELGAT